MFYVDLSSSTVSPVMENSDKVLDSNSTLVTNKSLIQESSSNISYTGKC